jgi:hypothetical protein
LAVASWLAAGGTILQLVTGVIDNVGHEQANCCIPEDLVRLSANANTISV